jgi:hypothetical protein
MNLLEGVEGTFPEEKQAMLAMIDRYLALPPEEKLLFRLGRWEDTLPSFDDLTDPVLRQRLQLAMKEMSSEAGGGVGKLITELGDQCI